MLFRLLRGTGLLGLGGISECRPLGTGVRLIRPLLSARRQHLLEYLECNGLSYRVDSTNQELGFARNRIRLELLPHLREKYNPAIEDILCRLASQAQEHYAEVASQAAALLADAELPRAGDTLVFSAAKLRQAPVNLVRELFRLVWARESWSAGNMDFAKWQRLAQVAQGDSPAMDFPGGIHVRRVGAAVQLRPIPYNR